ncbi:hypothetical protein QNM99_00375 [Pseudomonas sp. PCH446]
MRQQTLALAVCAALAAMPGLAPRPATAVAADPAGLLLAGQGASDGPPRLEQVVEPVPEQPDALYGLGLIDLQHKRLDGARRYLARLQAIKPLPRLALQLEQDIALSPDDKQQLLEKAVN